MLNLPALVVDELLSYLSWKEWILLKQVCHWWKEEIEIREKPKASLVFHLGYYPKNRGWLYNHKLMKISNSFELKSMNPLKDAATKRYLKRNLPNLRRVQIVHVPAVFGDNLLKHLHLYLAAFDQIEELELHGFNLEGEYNLVKLPKLKSLRTRKIEGDHLKLDCPLLKTLSLNGQFRKCSNKHPDQLKHLECSNRNYLANLKTKLKNLEYLNFYDEDSCVKGDLLKYTPKLKKLVLYTNEGRNELKKLEKQKQTYGLPDLKILINGFDCESTEFDQFSEATFCLSDDQNINELFENYPSLVEQVNYDVFIDYGRLFKRFRILPDNFFTKFPNIDCLVIGEVTNYTHLFSFLKHCPRLEGIIVEPSKIRDIHYLDQLFLVSPTLRILTIFEKQPTALFGYDYTFLSGLPAFMVRLQCQFLPDGFFEMVHRRCKHLLSFNQFYGDQQISVLIRKVDDKLDSLILNFGPFLEQFHSIEQLTSYMRNSPIFSQFMIRGKFRYGPY